MRTYKILLVSENVSVALVAARFLNKQGFAVSLAPDADTAMQMFVQAPADVVVLDELDSPSTSVVVLSRLREVSPQGATVSVVLGRSTLWPGVVAVEASRLAVAEVLDDPFADMAYLLKVVLAVIERGPVRQATPKDRSPAAPVATTAAQAGGPPPRRDEPQQSPARQAGAAALPPPPGAQPLEWADSPVADSLSDVLFPGGTGVESTALRLQSVRRPVPRGGTLKDFGLAELLFRTFAERFAGTLRVELEDTTKVIFFRKGVPVYVESAERSETLGAYLHRKGRLTEQQLDVLEKEYQRTRRKVGELLIQMGWISPHELFQVLADHVAEKIISCFGWPDGMFLFSPGQDLADQVVPFKMELPRVILDGVRRHYDQGRLDEFFPSWTNTLVFLRQDAPLRLDQLCLNTTEARLLDLAQRGLTVRELERQALGGRGEVRKLFLSLFVMEIIGFSKGSPTRLPVAAPRRLDAPPPPASSVMVGQEAALLEELRALESADYFELLGLTSESSFSQLHQAFRRQVKKFHPDKMMKYSVEVQRKGAVVYRRMVEAYRILADPKERVGYLQALRGEAKDGESSESRAEAAIAGKSEGEAVPRAELLRLVQLELTARKFREALQRLEAVRKKEPDDPQYQAWYGWTLYLSAPTVRRREAEKLLAEARKQAPDHPDPYRLHGYLKEREGLFEQALDLLVKASEKDPRNVDLAREARLLEMRIRKGTVKKREVAQSGETESESKGMLDQDVSAIFRKVFGKK